MVILVDYFLYFYCRRVDRCHQKNNRNISVNWHKTHQKYFIRYTNRDGKRFNGAYYESEQEVIRDIPLLTDHLNDGKNFSRFVDLLQMKRYHQC